VLKFKKSSGAKGLISEVVSCMLYLQVAKCKSKVKAIPLQARTGPKGSRRLRLPDFRTVGT
jgi:hypothetical protein